MESKILDDEVVKKEELTSNFSNYPTLSERLMALSIDGMVLLIMIISFSYLFSMIGEVSEQIRMIAFIFVFGIYEPLMTTLFGGSIGHFAKGIRVKKYSNHEKNISPFAAIFRFVIKLVLGILSFISVSSDSERRAIHDKLTGSIVIYKKHK